jgi:tetratricopeptide (TPR) repeat protein
MQENEEEGQQKNIGLKIKYILRVFLCTLIVFCLAIIVYNPEEQIKKNILSGDYDRAIYISSIGAKIYPKNSHWYSLRGYARFNNQDYSGALEDFDTAYRLENDVYKMMNFDNKIYIKYFLKDYKSALQDFDVEIEKCTTNDEKDSFLWDKAQFLYNIGEYQKALNIYNLLLERSKDDNIYLLKKCR